jgi:CDP-glycerol glycerophosphotransferase (TagB/SpsB family)
MSNKNLSVIIPIYNVEKYLSEALDSVVNQDIGFKENIQLILINDGSPDNSEEICLDYKARYPNNIIYIAQKNQGVSAARNKGLDTATGKYIAFFDPDDKLSLDAYRVTLDFFENHYDEIDLAAFKMKFFERLTGDHPLNYRFGETKVVDVRENPTYMQSSGVSCVYKAEVLKNRRFDPSIKYAEDMKLINEVILEKMAYGVVEGPIYFVRKRMDENSASNTGHQNPDYYMVTPVKVFKYLFDLWEKTNGKLDEFIQFVVLFDLQWRITQRAQVALTADEERLYRTTIRDLVKRVTSDEIILGMRNIRAAYKLFLLREKYGEVEFCRNISIRDSSLYLKDLNIDSALGYSVLPGIGIDRMEYLGDGRIKIEGYISGLLSTGTKYWAQTSQGKFFIKKNHHREVGSRNIFLGQQIDINEAFSVEVNTLHNDRVEFHYSLNKDDAVAVALSIKTGQFTGLGNINGAYNRFKELIIKKQDDALVILPGNFVNLVVSEIKFSLAILRRLKLRVATNELSVGIKSRLRNEELNMQDRVMSIVRPFLIPPKAVVKNIFVLALRVAARLARKLKRREIWLVSDRISDAADNGEAFYSYLQKNKTDKADYYFAINKQSRAYGRLRERGFKLVDLLGYRYKFLVLIADKIISSNADEMIFNPFLDSWSEYADLKTGRFIFLQHGITKDDLSRQYNRWNIGFDMVITSTQDEYDSFVKNKKYGFGRDIIKLTGMPRLDELNDNSENVISLLPTWRKGLDGGLDKRTGTRMYSPEFKKTEYFQFYNKLLTDSRLERVFEKKGIEGRFFLHPSFAAQAIDFSEGGVFKLQKAPYDYRQIFAESRLLITDYSSVAFDFAYLKKPIIYTQFDKVSFFNGHTYKEGYFSYVDDGFGPVVLDYEAVVEEIIRYIDSGCVMEDKYIKRVDKMFKFNDRNNSKRVYEAIINMS